MFESYIELSKNKLKVLLSCLFIVYLVAIIEYSIEYIRGNKSLEVTLLYIGFICIIYLATYLVYRLKLLSKLGVEKLILMGYSFDSLLLRCKNLVKISRDNGGNKVLIDSIELQ